VWKRIGHVPKKFSDAVWAEFKEACNHYFDRLHAVRNQNEEVEIVAFDKKKEYLEKLKDFEFTGNHKTDLDAIKAHIETWKSFGKVPFARRHIEGKFNKVLDVLFEKLSSSKKEAEMMRFNNRLEQLGTDTRRIDGEKIFIQRKIEEVQHEIFQLENNIQFFANAKNDNPMVVEVKKNIDRHKEELATWKEKLKQLRNM
jgi:cell division protein ZapA (FtsZ GTPase activity inhibitor)